MEGKILAGMALWYVFMHVLIRMIEIIFHIAI